MRYQPLGITVGFASFVFGTSAVIAQYNTADIEAFLKGQTRSCQGCDLQGIDLSNTRRVNAQLRQANLSRANFSNGYFEGSYFTCANLSNANLSQAKFPYANFVDANLIGADLNGADLSKADLSGAIIDNTTNLTDAKLDGTKLWDAKTLYQPGMDLSSIPRNEDVERQRIRCKNQSKPN